MKWTANIKKGKKEPKPAKRRRRGPSLSTIIIVTILLIGVGIIAYPTVSDWWNQYHMTRAISQYVTAVEEIDQETIDKMLRSARRYNRQLRKNTNRFHMNDRQRKRYESMLDIDGSGVMGYIQIESINVNLPIYHDVEETVLQVAIGHIPGTSLPVGGKYTHAVVSGHRGLPSARLFTDLDKLSEGDTFTITVLNQTITYEVDQIRVVEPSDMSDLNLVRKKDYVTLVTCTPYGINTHRLLVRGHRIDNIAGTIVIPAEALQIPNYIAVPAVGIPLLFIYLVGSLIYYRAIGPKYDHDKVMHALEELKEVEDASRAEQTSSASPADDTDRQRIKQVLQELKGGGASDGAPVSGATASQTKSEIETGETKEELAFNSDDSSDALDLGASEDVAAPEFDPSEPAEPLWFGATEDFEASEPFATEGVDAFDADTAETDDTLSIPLIKAEDSNNDESNG